MYQKAAPMLLVDDVDRAVAYYQDVFDAKLQHRLPKRPPFEWVSLLLDGVEIMFWRRDAVQKEYPNFRMASEEPGEFILYVYVDDVDTLYERVRDKAVVLMEPKDQFYGMREFTLRDCFGFVLTFAQVKE